MSASTEHAIVYGGSMVGLVTAGVLSRHFARVTLVERDVYGDALQPRKGVPQARLNHALLTRGMRVFQEIFPALEQRLVEAGGPRFDMGSDQGWFAHGGWRPRVDCGLRAFSVSRLLLESVVREQLRAIPHVRILDGREVTGFLTRPERARVTGVRLRAPGGGEEEALEGALVVDCTGRGSRTPQWLEALGQPRVEETAIRVNTVYACRLYRKPEGFAPGWSNLTLAPQMPRERALGIIQEIEGGRWQVLLGGWLGEGPEADDASFLAFARGLAQPHLYEAIREAEPLGPIHRYAFAHNQWRHYEKLARMPEGLAVAGDAFCSFNPIYGQGMTTGALQAELLGQCVREGLAGVGRRYHQRAGKMLQGPWGMATSGDLRFPEVEGRRPPGFGLMNWYGDRFQRLAGHDAEALRTLVRVVHMLEAPSALMSPRLLLKALTASPPAVLPAGPVPLCAPRRALTGA
ncbi:FAD-dependent oxidoreductase [Archangium primigenium]|uniref:FAD-dependent oxidoreductase n=1 Tax=[Archangium] primigenium TaxID=2792470 RepID=UPI00195786C4|nr:FAD-dependent monooxygenase [Archangium primigenium]MBM7117138.1 2-polyprenyl-6-methoxyphenol hydroxylase-like oxidoreductase [Archangium primigenium]